MNRAIVSIHDVMPSTMKEIAELLQVCSEYGTKRITLLVVPGLDWTVEMLDQLRSWQELGYEIAAHGWSHQCGRKSDWYHRFHSQFFSRNVAEHLSLTEQQVIDLMLRTANWFADTFHAIPQLYVPPAWALGRVSLQGLRDTPFAMVETLASVLDVRQGTRFHLPLLGFEADTRLRQCLLYFNNSLNMTLARQRKLAIRLAIHPYDHRLMLAGSLMASLRSFTDSLSYREILA